MHNSIPAATWHILGAGAIGQLMATKFLDAGLNVTLLTRPKPAAIRASTKTSIRLQRVEVEQTRAFALDSEPVNLRGPIQQLLITTKSNQVLQALTDVGPRLDKTSKVILLHNGMGTLEPAQQQLSSAQVYCGITTEGAYQRATPSTKQLIYAGKGTTEIGQPGQRLPPAWLQPLLTGNLGFSWQSDIVPALWRKLLINCAVNPLTAIHDCRNGALLKNPALRAQLQLVVTELELVAQAVGQRRLAVNLLPLVEQVLAQTGDNYSSMQQDVQHQRLTEIAYINGYLCQQAKLKGIATPMNTGLVAAVRHLEQAYESRG